MHMIQKLFVANWKMNKSFSQEVEFCKQHHKELQQLSSKSNVELVICPSFPSLFLVAEQLKETMVSIGAQQCSTHQAGAYTGQVSAQSLEETGCRYCIVGHSEVRATGTTNEHVAQQTTRLFEQNITPIICIGEQRAEYEQGIAFDILHSQLDPILKSVKSHNKEFVVAYEPVWSIGTGLIPDSKYLHKVYRWLNATIQEKNLQTTWRLLYGGSVDEKNIQTIIKVGEINGFLIGGASLDFQKFQKIVLLGI